MKRYVVVYISPGGMHYRYRCIAKDKKDAKRQCKNSMGADKKDIVDVYKEMD